MANKKYTVVCEVHVRAKDSDSALKLAHKKLPRGSFTLKARLCDEVRTIISPEMRNFIAAEINNNDDDQDGYNTDLDYVKSSLDQMPVDIIWEQCQGDMEWDGDGDPTDNDHELLSTRMNKELELLIKVHGGGADAGTLIEEAESQDEIRSGRA